MDYKERKESQSTEKQVWSEAKGLDQGQSLETLEKKQRGNYHLRIEKKTSKEVIN